MRFYLYTRTSPEPKILQVGIIRNLTRVALTFTGAAVLAVWCADGCPGRMGWVYIIAGPSLLLLSCMFCSSGEQGKGKKKVRSAGRVALCRRWGPGRGAGGVAGG